jgi:hypothetical protein
VERIEGAAAREARTRGWDLNEIKDLMRRMLAETQCTLREGDSTLCEQKSAHHAACVEALASEASVADGTKCWSRQDCAVFCKELDWELQAFRKANAELELLVLPMDKREAAHLRAEGVGAAAHCARQVVERVLWNHDCGWEESQRLGWIIISPSAQRRAASGAAGEECRPALSLTGKASPRELCRWRTRSGAFRSGPGTHRERPKWIRQMAGRSRGWALRGLGKRAS